MKLVKSVPGMGTARTMGLRQGRKLATVVPYESVKKVRWGGRGEKRLCQIRLYRPRPGV